jgi:DNA-binding transcriptional LysR family regulator
MLTDIVPTNKALAVRRPRTLDSINVVKNPRLDWSDLYFFLAVARTGRLTMAARRLQVDHSTVSRRIAALEAALRTKLFDRRQTGYTLTEQGERLLESVEAIESTTSRIASRIGGANLSASGSVRIGVPDGFGSLFLAPKLGKLLDAHPGLEVEMVAMSRIFNLSKREADLAVTLSRPKEGRLHARKLVDYNHCLYASADYLAKHGPIKDRKELLNHRFIGYIEDMIYAPELDYMDEIARDLRPRLKTSSPIAQFRATIAGNGICMLPHFMACMEPTLVPVLSKQITLQRTLWLVMHSDMRDLARVRVTADFIAQEVQAAKIWLKKHP